jgi:hypothetical protein
LTGSRSASSTISRSARRATVRQRCSDAAAGVPPGSTNEVSGSRLAVERVDLALQPLDLACGDSSRSRAFTSGVARSAPRSKRSFWMRASIAATSSPERASCSRAMPTWALSSSIVPIASKRRSDFRRRSPVASALVPSSPVRV